MITLRRPRGPKAAEVPDKEVELPAFEGCLQGVGNGHALGWCWAPASPQERVRVAIVVDGEIVAEGPADVARNDLAEYGDGAHGFMIALPDSLQAPGRHRVLALVGAENFPLVTAPSFWHEAKSGNGWSDVVFEAVEPGPNGGLSAKIPAPPTPSEPRAVSIDNWLFDASEFEPPPEPSSSDLEAIVTALTSTGETCSALGLSYLPVIVPAKRRLVDVGPSAGRSFVAELNARLRDVDEIELMNLLPVLRQAKRHGPPYHRTDADWNDLGAFFVARALLKEAHKRVPALRPTAFADLHLRPLPRYRGPLAEASKLQLVDGELLPYEANDERTENGALIDSILGPPNRVIELEDGVVIDASRLHALRMPVETPLAEAGSAHLRVYSNPSTEEDARLAIVGDAAALPLIPWLSERTRRTTFFWSKTLPIAQLELELPPIVIHLIREADLLNGSLVRLTSTSRHPTLATMPTSTPDQAHSNATATNMSTGLSTVAPLDGSKPDTRIPALAPLFAMALDRFLTTTRKHARSAGATLKTRAWTIALVGLLTALSWPFTYVKGGGGLDNSWVVGLSLAVSHGLAFGRQVIFTYGPLGFSQNPVAVTPGMLFVGELLGGLIQLALVAVLLANLRRRMNLLTASVLTLLAASIVGWLEAEPLSGIAFGLVALAYTVPAGRRELAFRRLAIGGGALVGFALLVKLNDGVATGAILALGLLGGDDRRRGLARAAASMLGTLVVLWLLLGQPPGALPDYLRNSYDVIGGYVEAMGREAGSESQWQLLVVIGSAIALAIGAWRSQTTEHFRRGAALAGAVLAVHYFVAREAFVRYDSGHVAVIALLGAVALMVPWPRAQRGTGLALAALLMVATFAALARPVDGIVHPLQDAHELVDQAREVLHPAGLIAEGRAGVNRDNALPPAMVTSLRGHCVTAEPDEIAAIWAHPRWRWCPLPVFQSYTAYTPRLDHLNAAAYADARHGTDRVLRQVDQAIDEQNPIWESPAAMLSMLCHFTEIEHSGEWQTLARVPDRCGTPHPMATIHTSLRQTIKLPAPPEHAVMVAAIDGVQVAGWERLETLFTRANPRYVTVNGQQNLRFRVPPATASDGLILAVPSDADYAAPFNLNMNPRTLRVGVREHHTGAVTIRLFAVPIQ